MYELYFVEVTHPFDCQSNEYSGPSYDRTLLINAASENEARGETAIRAPGSKIRSVTSQRDLARLSTFFQMES